MNGPFTEAQLTAFLDGKLDDDALVDAIEAAINADPALAEKIERLAVADDGALAVRQAFAPVLDAPVPDHLAQIVASSSADSAVVADFAAARAKRDARQPANDNGRAWRWPQFAAMAASLMVGVMIGGPLLVGGADSDRALVLAGADGFATAPVIAAMLDTAPSGQSVDLAGLGAGEVVLTFRNSDRQLCRQFTIEGADTTSDALACAGADGGWRIEALGRRAAPAGDMKLAGGDAAVSVVAAVDAMIDSDPLVGDAEAAELKAK
ncbi:MAG: hypothetical protein H2056_09310 [Sphingopyxis sp.]|nr:hypothetical protein [Sphingopyxis sp.]